MKILMLLLLMVILLNACCKCDIPRNWEGFRFIDSSGHDLVYGPNPKYDKDSIRFFYINNNGRDTTLPSRALEVAVDSHDTVTVVAFSQAGKDTAYVDFRNGDIDTLIL